MASAFKTPRKENVKKNPPLLSPPEKEAALGRTSSLPKYFTESPTISKITQRRHPVQRAPSRLYRAELKTNFSNTAKYYCPNTCIGPEFVVRASHPCKLLQLETRCSVNQKRQILVILLNGQKIEISCDSSLTTAGHVFESLVRSEGMADNFMLGLAALVGGDFIFLHPDTRLRKIAPPTWGKDSLPSCSLTLYLRIKFFLPSLRGIRNWTMKHQLYLQLRRCLLEQQIICDLTTYVMLGGLALQAEFGDYSDEEHGSSDYFFLEHYIPENLLERPGLKTELQEAHKRRKGLDPGRAEEQFVIQVQTQENYGYHFYHATMIKKDMKHDDVRIAVNPEGITLFKSENYHETESEKKIFLWKDIQKLWYSKHYFMLQPNSLGKICKQKYFMDFKKSFYVFHLATSHHQFFLKFRNTLSSLQPLSTQFGIKVKDSTNDMKSQHKTMPAEEKYGTLSRGDMAQLHKISSVLCDNTRANCKTEIMGSDGKCNASKRLISLGTCSVESLRDKENENPVKSMQVCQDIVPLRPSTLTNNLFCRPRVKMGTKVLTCTAQRALFVTHGNTPEDTVSLPELSDGSPCETPPPEAYVINSSIKSIDEQFEIDFQESLSQSLLEKFDQMPYDEERHLKTVIISKDENGSLGIQITKHIDGGIYIRDVLPGGPVGKLGSVKKDYSDLLPPVPAPRTKKKNRTANENKNISFEKEHTITSLENSNIFEAAYVSHFNISETSNNNELCEKLSFTNSYIKVKELKNDYMIESHSSSYNSNKFEQVESTVVDNCFSNLKDELQEDDDSGVYTSDTMPLEAKGSDNFEFDTIKIGDLVTLESVSGRDTFNADCLTGSIILPHSHNINENFDFKQKGGALPISSTEYDKYFLIDVSQDGDNNSASSEVLTNQIIKTKCTTNSLEVSVQMQGEPSVLPIFNDVCSEVNVSLDNSKHVSSISSNEHHVDVKVEELTLAVESDHNLKTVKEITIKEKTAEECGTVLQVGSPFEAPKLKEQPKPKYIDIGSIFETYKNDLVVDDLENKELRPKDICVIKTDHYSNISKDFSLFISNMLHDRATDIIIDNISISQNSNFVNKTNIFNNDSLEADKCVENSCFVFKSHLKENVKELFADCNDSNFTDSEENILNLRNAALDVNSNENFNTSNIYVSLDNCCEDTNSSQTKEHIDASEHPCQLGNLIFTEDLEKIKPTISDSLKQCTIADTREKTSCMLPENSQMTQNLDHKVGDNLWGSDCETITRNSKCSLPSFESFIAKSSDDKVTKFSSNSRSNSPFEIILDNNLWNNLQRSNSSARESDCEYHNSITIPNRSFVS